MFLPEPYLLMCQVDDAQNSVGIRLLIIYFDSSAHLVLFNHDISKITQIQELGIG